jgi:hypothetical protein
VLVADFFLTATGTHEKGAGGDGENRGGSRSQYVPVAALCFQESEQADRLLSLLQRSTSTLLRPRARRFLSPMSSRRGLLRECLPPALAGAPKLIQRILAELGHLRLFATSDALRLRRPPGRSLTCWQRRRRIRSRTPTMTPLPPLPLTRSRTSPRARSAVHARTISTTRLCRFGPSPPRSDQSGRLRSQDRQRRRRN